LEGQGDLHQKEPKGETSISWRLEPVPPKKKFVTVKERRTLKHFGRRTRNHQKGASKGIFYLYDSLYLFVKRIRPMIKGQVLLSPNDQKK